MGNFFRYCIVASLVGAPVPAKAWDAIDAMTGRKLRVEWPERVGDIREGGIQEIRYRFVNESVMRIGKVVEIDTHCEGPYCMATAGKVFRMETFSSLGVLVCVPINK